MSVAFDTLKFARALRERANMSAEQAEGVAEAFSGATTEQLATKSDLVELKSEIVELKSEFVELKSDLRQTELRLDAKIEAVRAEVVLLRWMIGFSLALLVAVFGKLFLR